MLACERISCETMLINVLSTSNKRIVNAVSVTSHTKRRKNTVESIQSDSMKNKITHVITQSNLINNLTQRHLC